MDENKNYKDPEREGNDNDTYDPYEEYVKDKVHEEQKEEYGDSYARYTDPQMGPEDDRGRDYWFIFLINGIICKVCGRSAG